MLDRAVVFYGSIVIIILLSFVLNAAYFLPDINSDMAIHILMSESFRFPEDLYYWGQNRLGSIIPLIGFLFVKIGLKPIVAVSIASYLLLTSTFYFFSKTIKSKSLIITFACLFFFPLSFFNQGWNIGQPYIGQFFFLSIPYCVYYKIITKEWDCESAKFRIVLPIATFSLGLSIWASELSIVTLLLFTLGTGYLFFLKLKKTHTDEKKIKSLIKLSLLAGAGFMLAFWIYRLAKNTAVGQTYSDFLVSPEELKELLNSCLKNSWLVLTFQTNELLPAIAVYFLIATSIYLVLFEPRKKWYVLDLETIGNFALLNSIISLLLVCLSKWVFLNEVNPRYFFPAYLWIIIAFVHFADREIYYGRKAYLFLSLGFFVVLINFLPFSKFVNRKSHYQQFKSFDQLGEANILSGYWDSYRTSVSSPERIKTLPFEKELVRNEHQIDSFFSRRKIYLMYSASDTSLFAPEICQFSYQLIKKGEPFSILNFHLCEYENQGYCTEYVFPASQLRTSFAARRFERFSDQASDTASVLSTEGVFDGHSGCFSFGPYIRLAVGRYKVKWYIRKGQKAINAIASVDISTDSGQLVINKKEVYGSVLESNKYSIVELDFKVTNPQKSYEFRLIDHGVVPLSMSKITVSKLDH